MTDKRRIVIVGCGMGGAKLVEELTRREEAAELDISIIGEEPGGNYDRIKLSEHLKRDDPESFWLNTAPWFADRGVTAHLGEPVVAIDRRERTVSTAGGAVHPYDTLVLATGAAPVVPPMEGASLEGVFTLRNLDDIRAIRSRTEGAAHVTVIGGGLLGLELADTLRDTGKEVTVCHLEATLMERQLAPAPAAALEALFRDKGIDIRTRVRVTAIRPAGERLALTLAEAEGVTTDAVIVNCGITPNADLARGAGLCTEQGVVVDESLRTSDPHIHALGECVVFRGETYGLLVPIYAQARALADILAGRKAVYTPPPSPVTTLKSDIAAVSMGKPEPEEGDEVVLYDNPRSHIYKRLIINDNRVVGACLVGDSLNGDAIGGYYTSGLPLPRRVESLIFPGVKRPEQVSNAVFWPDSVTVCDCNGITAGAIRQAVRVHRDNIGAIKEETRAAVNCGTCLSRVEAIVESSFDAIVVGAGLGGLSCGARLAREGRRVLVIEQHEKVGGFAGSFTREGFTFDVSLHNMGPLTGAIEKMLQDLGVLDSIHYVPFDYFQRMIFPRHDIVLRGGMAAFTELLLQGFPEEREGILTVVEEMRTIRAGFEEIESLTLEDKQTDDVTPLIVVKYPQFADLIMTTWEELVGERIKDETLKGLLGNMWWYLGLPPSEVASLLYALVAYGYMDQAGGALRGTSQTLSNALADQVREHGGEVLLSTTVARILVKDGKVDGVLTDEGTVFYADKVVSNAGVHNTFTRMVDPAEVPKKWRKKVTRTEGSVSAVQLYLGIDCPPEALGMEEHSFTWFPTYDHDENYRRVMAGEHRHSLFSCTAYSAFDDTLAPEGKGVINIFSLDNPQNWEGLSKSAYEARKREVTEQLLDKVAPMLPHLREHILVKELGTPRTMHRYTLNPEGAIFGPSQTVFQSGLNRFKPKTPIDGLYLVGSSIYPGGGYPSVISSGYRAAAFILNEMKSDS